MSDKQFKLFYSWQLWTEPQKGQNNNRNFIEDALKRAAKQVKHNSKLSIVIDSDTRGVPGSPPIVETILKKIDTSDMIVADVTYVSGQDNRYTPNPNVLIELGYALKQLTGYRLIMIMNTAHGDPEKYPFPFDFQHRRRATTYNLKPDADTETRRRVRDKLVKDLVGAIELVLADTIQPDESLVDTIERYVRDKDQISLDKIFAQQIRLVHETINSPESYQIQSQLAGSSSPDAPKKLVDYYVEICGDVLKSFAFLAKYGDESHVQYIEQAIRLWAKEGENKLYVRFYLVILLIYTVGVIAIANNRWEFLLPVFDSDKITHPVYSLHKDHTTNIAMELVTNVYRKGGRPEFVVGEVVSPVIKTHVSDYFVIAEDFNREIVEFEMFFALHYIHSRMVRPHNFDATPPPRITNTVICEILNEWGKKVSRGNDEPFVKLFDNIERLVEILEAYTKDQQRKQWAYGGGVNYLRCFKEGLGESEL